MRWVTRHVVGLDLGQVGDFSALACLRWTEPERAAAVRKRDYEVPCLRRWQLGTAYKAVGGDLARFLALPDLAGAELVIDATGVGVAVVELVTEALAAARVKAPMVQATITGGNAVSKAGRGRWNVSKRHLVSVLSAVVHGGRMRVAQDQPEAEALVREMQTFKAKIDLTTGNESFEAWRERDHDDLVLAVALAAWWAERPRPVAGAVG